MALIPRIAVTTGEPAGIGPDICLAIASRPWAAELVAIGDPELLQQRAQQLDIAITIEPFRSDIQSRAHTPGTLTVLPVQLAQPCRAGQLDPNNAHYVLETLHRAVDGCVQGQFNAMVTAPVQKSVINDAGIAFSGHTELLAERTGTRRVVMMLASEDMRVALATTHLPLREVPDAITQPLLIETLRIVHRDLQSRFGIREPRIAVLGLNPHAGEAGHIGREEIEVIMPAMRQLAAESIDLLGPLPADTAFNPKVLATCNAVFAMYHDQGLPTLKYASFGNAVNITLGLPIIRTSVDHGTALDLAGAGGADAGSLVTALNLAIQMSQHSASSA